MEKVAGIGGVFFRAKNPTALTRWYENVLGVNIRQGIWNQESGPTVFTPFAEDTDYFGRPEQQWMINFRVSDLDAMTRQLRTQGVEVVTKAEWNSHAGRFARIHDPEGNPIELWEPATREL